jgi:hypothetical protein
MRSRKITAPSPAAVGSSRETANISFTASLMRAIAGCDRQPKALRRNLALNSHLRAGAAFTGIYLRALWTGEQYITSL